MPCILRKVGWEAGVHSWLPQEPASLSLEGLESTEHTTSPRVSVLTSLPCNADADAMSSGFRVTFREPPPRGRVGICQSGRQGLPQTIHSCLLNTVIIGMC